MDATAVAKEFLDQWERMYDETSGKPGADNYTRLGQKFAAYTGEFSLGEADELAKALAVERKARGWPDAARTDPKGRMLMTIEIETGIMTVWLGGLRRADANVLPFRRTT